MAQAIYKMVFGDRDPVAEPGTASGSPGNWWTVFALVPDASIIRRLGFSSTAHPQRRLPARLRELGQTRAGYVVGRQFVFSQHCKAMRDVDFTDAQVAAIANWSIADSPTTDLTARRLAPQCLVGTAVCHRGAQPGTVVPTTH